MTCIKINYSILYFKNTKIYFQENMTSNHKPPLYIGIFDREIISDSFSLLQRACYESVLRSTVSWQCSSQLDHCGHVKKSCQISRHDWEQQKRLKFHMQVTWPAPPKQTQMFSLVLQFLIAVHCDITQWYMTSVMGYKSKHLSIHAWKAARSVSARSWPRLPGVL